MSARKRHSDREKQSDFVIVSKTILNFKRENLALPNITPIQLRFTFRRKKMLPFVSRSVMVLLKPFCITRIVNKVSNQRSLVFLRLFCCCCVHKASALPFPQAQSPSVNFTCERFPWTAHKNTIWRSIRMLRLCLQRQFYWLDVCFVYISLHLICNVSADQSHCEWSASSFVKWVRQLVGLKKTTCQTFATHSHECKSKVYTFSAIKYEQFSHFHFWMPDWLTRQSHPAGCCSNLSHALLEWNTQMFIYSNKKHRNSMHQMKSLREVLWKRFKDAFSGLLYRLVWKAFIHTEVQRETILLQRIIWTVVHYEIADSSENDKKSTEVCCRREKLTWKSQLKTTTKLLLGTL